MEISNTRRTWRSEPSLPAAVSENVWVFCNEDLLKVLWSSERAGVWTLNDLLHIETSSRSTPVLESVAVVPDWPLERENVCRFGLFGAGRGGKSSESSSEESEVLSGFSSSSSGWSSPWSLPWSLASRWSFHCVISFPSSWKWALMWSIRFFQWTNRWRQKPHLRGKLLSTEKWEPLTYSSRGTWGWRLSKCWKKCCFR